MFSVIAFSFRVDNINFRDEHIAVCKILLGAVWMGATARHRAWRSVAGISGVTLQVSTIIEHRIICALCVYPCLLVKNFQYILRAYV